MDTIRDNTNPVEAAKVALLRGTGIGLNWFTAIQAGMAAAQEVCHGLSKRSGWWNNKDGSAIDTNDPLVFGTKVALIHSEVSEAMEGGRKGKMDDHLPHRKAEEVELADAIIRIMDLAGARKLDVAGAIIEKLAYNQQRADHKPENRALAGGKAF